MPAFGAVAAPAMAAPAPGGFGAVDAAGGFGGGGFSLGATAQGDDQSGRRKVAARRRK